MVKLKRSFYQTGNTFTNHTLWVPRIIWWPLFLISDLLNWRYKSDYLIELFFIPVLSHFRSWRLNILAITVASLAMRLPNIRNRLHLSSMVRQTKIIGTWKFVRKLQVRMYFIVSSTFCGQCISKFGKCINP